MGYRICIAAFCYIIFSFTSWNDQVVVRRLVTFLNELSITILTRIRITIIPWKISNQNMKYISYVWTYIIDPQWYVTCGIFLRDLWQRWENLDKAELKCIEVDMLFFSFQMKQFSFKRAALSLFIFTMEKRVQCWN